MNELENVISIINEKYNFYVRVFNKTVYIETLFDQWYCEEEESRINLYHKNKWINRKKHHMQRNLANYEQVFDCIYGHKGDFYGIV